jgi:hypothetical protein
LFRAIVKATPTIFGEFFFECIDDELFHGEIPKLGRLCAPTELEWGFDYQLAVMRPVPVMALKADGYLPAV